MPSTDSNFSQDATTAAQYELERLVAANVGITLAVLTSSDGFEVAAHPPQRNVTQRLAAMSSSLQALSEAIVREAGFTNSSNLIIESDSGAIIVMGVAHVASRLSLAVVGSAGANLGHVLWASRNCCASLERSW